MLADVSGRRPPRLTVPSGLLRALAPAAPLVSRLLGLPPNLRELVRCSAGATYWASSDKAMDELGWTHRPLRDGLSGAGRAVLTGAAREGGRLLQDELRRAAERRCGRRDVLPLGQRR